MAWIRWDLIFSISFFVSPAFTDQSGFRRFYVLQPGPSGTDRVHVSSISSRSGATGQPHSYNVELTSSFGGQVRTRRMGNQANPIPLRQDTQFTQHQQVIRHTSHNVHQNHQMKLSGVNVCGGQCCHGWSKAPGSQRCTKPNCTPQCQNGGMCLRPQHCVCKPGSKGKVCEQKTLPTSSYPGLPGNGHTNGQSNGHTNGPTNGHNSGHNLIPQRPIPQQVPPQGFVSAPVRNTAQMRLTIKQSPHVVRPPHVQQQIRPIAMRPGQSQQFVVNPKYYHTHTTHTQTHVQHQPDRPIPFTLSQNPPHVGNQTGRIKVVFTPTICKVTCMGGRCHNNCELGNTTTIISENGHATDTLTAPNFRVVVCHLPCINGGKCSSRDKCQCPPNFTGKFCQMPVQNGQHPHQTSSSFSHTSQVHSTHTLPLTFSNGQNPVKYSPSIVNIHVKHPPEASVQIHQVSQLDSNGHKVKGSSHSSQSGSHYTTYHLSERSQKVQQHQPQSGHNGVYPGQPSYTPQYQPVTSKSQLGRCFQETSGTQCGKALPGLSKQEDCCGTVGTSWGFHKCQKCPKKPSIPLTGSRTEMDCPPGYKRINNSNCQDLNECQLQGVCPNGDCVNTMGSYRCLCKAGYIPDPTLSTCLPGTHADEEEKGACFRLVSSGRQCLHPVSTQLSKQLCCCSVGKAWGPRCDKCPLQGTAKFKEICPGGMGYTVLPKPLNRGQPDTNRPIQEPVVTFQEPVAPPLPLPTPEKPVEALSVTERQLPAVPVVEVAPEQELDVEGVGHSPVVEPIQPQLSPGVSTITIGPIYPEVVERTSPPAPVEILPSNAGQDIAPTQVEEVNECQVSPYICGQGTCYNRAEGYICVCEEGYQLDDTQTTCEDVDECEESPPLCSNGRCENTPGSFLCVCQHGFMVDEEGTSCIDVDECLNPDICPDDSICINKLGYHICRHCDGGYRVSPAGECEDIDECLDPSMCANGRCSNFEGYFVCSCDDGFTLSSDGQSCEDVDECQDVMLCTRGHCQNTEGSFLCSCEPGFVASPDGDQCVDVDECVRRPCESVGQCVNTLGSYQCSCPQGYRQVNGTACQDVDECLDDPDLCLPNGECLNVEGSFHCLCESGFAANDQHTCEDVDECLANETLCGSHGFCENTVGSFRCLCDRGFQESPEGHCVDVNECELLVGVCGEAQCENVEGAFFCTCPEKDQEYDQMTAKCSPTPTASSVERKECYFHLNNENLCENVLTSHVTLEECCCTLGAGWGDNCEVHPCPVQGTDQFNQMCPAGQGSVPIEDSVSGVDDASRYKDADECALFGEEICKDGFCLNSPGSYECYCKSGLYYDEAKLQCRDIDECLDESICVGGMCVNSEGSYTCFCTYPMVLDPENKRCVLPPEVAEHNGNSDYQEICWQTVTDTFTCTKPLANKKTTYTECCCLFGEAWGMDCALCPPKNTEDYASMCNVPVSGGRRPYGRDALVAGPVHQYEESHYRLTDDSLSMFEEEEEKESPYASFEGLRAEECGILNGCENGRCVRVQEGYTCDCFDGYTLDMTRMACVDVNECSELNSRMSLCKNAKCINTQGSYKCVCLPGYKASERPNYCVPGKQDTAENSEME